MNLTDLAFFFMVGLAIQTLIMGGLVIAYLITSRRRPRRIEPQKNTGLGQVLIKLRK